MKYAFYPGCSGEHRASAYQDSLELVADFLNLELSPIPDWNCCGATAYLSVNRLGAYALSARNLALVPKGCDQVVTSCSACYLNLKKTDKILAENPDIAKDVNAALAEGNLSYSPGIYSIRHILEVFINDIGLDAIKGKVVSPLSGLRVAPFYGCMLVRPNNGYDHPEFPHTLDDILSALGAEVLTFSMKTHCCGGHMSQIKAITGYELLRRILGEAQGKGAGIIAVTCPACQLNLDAYQDDVNKTFGTNFRIPVMFFTQLMGLAFGLDRALLGLGKELISAHEVLSFSKGLQPGNKIKKDKSKTALPASGAKKR